MHPAVPDPVVLPREVEQGLGEVARDPGLEQGEELYLGAVLVPAGEVAVLRALAAGETVHGAVHAVVAAVDVTDQVGLHERVVERRVEGGAPVGGAAVDPYGAQLAVPDAASGVGHVRDARVRGDLPAQVGLGAAETDVRDADPHVDIVVSAGVEADVPAGAAARPVGAGGVALSARGGGGPRGQGAVLPGADGGEVPVEGRAEVQPVVALAVVGAPVGAAAAERAGQHRAGHPAVRGVDVDLRVLAAVEGVGDPEEQVGGTVGREGEVGDARPPAHREVGRGARGEPERVAPGYGLLGGVREVGRVHRVLGVGRGRGRDVTDVRHDRDVARRAGVASGSVDMGEAQTADAGDVVPVAVGGPGAGLVAGRAGRGPADHPLREGGAGVGGAVVRRSDQRVHQGRRPLHGGDARVGGERGREGEGGGHEQGGGSAAEPSCCARP